jgi:hypothetical protein
MVLVLAMLLTKRHCYCFFKIKISDGCHLESAAALQIVLRFIRREGNPLKEPQFFHRNEFSQSLKDLS